MATQTTLPIRRFNVDEYYKMGEIGILPREAASCSVASST